MSKRSVERIDMVNGDVHIGDKIYAEGVFDGDYSRSDCSDAEYAYRPIWTKAALFMVFFLFVLLKAASVFLSIKNIGLFSNDVSSQSDFFEIFLFGIFIWLIYIALPLMSNKFKIYFYPKKGVIVVGGRTVYFADVQSMVRNGDMLSLLFKNGKRLNIVFSGADYVNTCISRLWNMRRA